MSKKPEIRIDIADWDQEFMEAEPDLSSDEAIANESTRHTTPSLARMTIAARERGIAPDDILSANKVLLQCGARTEISSKITRRKEKVQLANGLEVTIREFVGAISEREEPEGDDQLTLESTADTLVKSDEPETYVRWQDEQAKERVYRYLQQIVPGHIYTHLAHLAAAGEDVRQAANDLSDRIEEMVAELT